MPKSKINLDEPDMKDLVDKYATSIQNMLDGIAVDHGISTEFIGEDVNTNPLEGKIGVMYADGSIDWDQEALNKYLGHTDEESVNNSSPEPNTEESGGKEEFITGAVRDTHDDKPRIDLISPYAQIREGKWLAEGAKKYDARNWEKGIPISRCIASLERHVQAYKMGKTDEDHMAAIRTNAGFIIHYEEMIKKGILPDELDDMPKYEQKKRLSYDEMDELYKD